MQNLNKALTVCAFVLGTMVVQASAQTQANRKTETVIRCFVIDIMATYSSEFKTGSKYVANYSSVTYLRGSPWNIRSWPEPQPSQCTWVVAIG